MFCGKCGANLPEGVKFCPNCGSPVAPAEPAAPAEPVAPVQSVPYAAPAASIPDYGSGAYRQPVNDYPNAYAPVQNGRKAKGGKKKTGIIVLCVILAVIVALGVAAACLWQTIARSVLGEVGFYAWREAKTIDKILTVEGAEAIFDNETVKASSKIKIDANDSVYDKAFDAVSADVGLSFDSSEDKAVAVIGLVSGDETKVQANCSFDNGRLGISVPALTEETFCADLDFLDFDSISLDYETIGKELLNIYNQIDGEHLSVNTTVTKEKIDNVKCRCVTLSVDGEEASALLADILTAVRNDDTLINSLDPAFRAVYDAACKLNPEMKTGKDEKTYEDYKKEILVGIDILIKKIQTSEVGNDVNLTLGYSSDSKGYITNRKIAFTSDGETVFSINVDSHAFEKTIGVDIISEENKTDFAVIRSDSSQGVNFHIFGKSVSLSDGKEENGGSFDVMIKDFAAVSVNGVNVPVGNIDISVIPIYNGKANEDKTVSVDINLSNSDTYNITAKLSANELDYQLDIVSELSAAADFSAFINPDKEGLTDFNAFIESMSDRFDEVAADILENVDRDLLLKISKTAQIKDCEAREKLIEDNLVKYIKTGNKGKPFKKVADVLAKQSAYDKMFEEGHPPYCTGGGNKDGVKYKITVSNDLSHEVKCQNPACPNYGN